LQAVSFGSFDVYPVTNAWSRNPGSDFKTVHEDGLYMQGLATAAMVHFAAPGQPVWAFVESGGDNLGFSSQNSAFPGKVTSGSNVLTNISGWSHFTSTWLGLTVSGSGIPSGTKITSIIDATHAQMSQSATATVSSVSVSVTGGDSAHTDCVAKANLCVVNGNALYATPEEVNAEVWMSLINGANGIEYFCHDMTSNSFCFGDATGGKLAATAQTNISYINKHVMHFAAALNSTTAGRCSMQLMNYTTGVRSTASSCTDGIVKMTTNVAALPGMVLVKQRPGGSLYVFAQSDRRSSTGGKFDFTLSGYGGKTASIVYDSNNKYNKTFSAEGKTIALNASGHFSDTFGANNSHYQVKIYKIE